jgi:hypothetical protein
MFTESITNEVEIAEIVELTPFQFDDGSCPPVIEELDMLDIAYAGEQSFLVFADEPEPLGINERVSGEHPLQDELNVMIYDAI